MKSFFDYFDKIDNERFSIVCFIIYKTEDSFHLDLLHTFQGIHFIMDGIHSYHGIQFVIDRIHLYHSNKPVEWNHVFDYFD